MIINNANTSLNRDRKTNPSFKGNLLVDAFGSNHITKGFEWLKKRPVIEIAGIDAVTMIIPRTLVDLGQNAIYACETFAREFIPMLPNPFMPGLVGNFMRKMKGYEGLYANSSTMRVLHEGWKKAGGEAFDPNNPSRKIIENYVKTVFANTEGLAGKKNNAITGKALDDISKRLTDLILNRKNMPKADYKKAFDNAVEGYTKATGAASSVDLKLGKEVISTSSERLARDTVDVAEQIFTKAPKKAGSVIDDLEKFAQKTTAIAVGSSIALGASVQKMITMVTEKVTGVEGFTGYKDAGTDEAKKAAARNREEQNIESKEEEIKEQKDLATKKALAIAGMGALMLATMGAFSKKGLLKKDGLKQFAKNLELKDPWAHMDIIKLVYGSILMGRFVAARDETELKTSVVRDYAGFLNWLVLGGVVAKGIAHTSEKLTGAKLVNISGPIKDKNIFKTAKNWLENVSVKSISERKAMESLSKFPKPKLSAALHNGAMIGGLAYALFAIGYGVPKLINKFIIDKSREKQIESGHVYAAGLDSLNKTIPFSQLTSGQKTKNEDNLEHLFDRFEEKIISYSHS